MIKEHQTVIVTGASRGVGVYIAKALAKEGMNLVLAARNAANLDNVANEIKASGAQVATIPTDISNILLVFYHHLSSFIITNGASFTD